MVAKALVIEQYARDNERSCQRAAAGLVRACDEAGA
jgi:hypothetical protein